MQKKLKNFLQDGFVKFENILDPLKCLQLYEKLKNDRNWGPNLFQSEESYLDEFKHKPIKKVNPGKGIQNLIDKFDLNFIENNNHILKILHKILGNNFEIMLSKFVVAVPKKWMPNYVKKIHNFNTANFNPYIKKEYRDVTYFRGIDYHMDSIDWENNDNKFVTMYVYLNNVDENMSPLNIVKQSHLKGPTSFPHFIKDDNSSKYLQYSSDNKLFREYEKETLIGNEGTVYFWTSNTLHGTAPSISDIDNFRISVRYLIKKKDENSKGLIDQLINEKKVGITKKKNPFYKTILK